MDQTTSPLLRPPMAAYVHIPFCISKCYYCDFNSYPGLTWAFDDYTRALISEIERAAAKQAGLSSIYFGGGTPTVLSEYQLAAILFSLIDSFGIAPDPEVTVEANPGTVDRPKLAELRRAGFNRLSMGVQSFDEEFLKKIGRVHDVKQAIDAYESARQAGFANIGIDLIFALPGQTIDHWNNTLDRAIELNPEHISLYELSIEEGTRFAQMCARGELDLVDEDIRFRMYEITISRLVDAGFEHYEVSNFARPGFRSRHNCVYWRNDPYYGFGAGATSYVDGCRARRVGDPRDYIRAIESDSDALEFSEHLTGRALAGETIIQGLRMLDGVDLNEVSTKAGVDARREFAEEIARLRERGLIEEIDLRIKVTHRGLLLLNNVAEEFACPE